MSGEMIRLRDAERRRHPMRAGQGGRREADRVLDQAELDAAMDGDDLRSRRLEEARWRRAWAEAEMRGRGDAPVRFTWTDVAIGGALAALFIGGVFILLVTAL